MDHLRPLQKHLEEISRKTPLGEFSTPQTEYRWQLIIEAAVRAADEIIMEGSDGTPEETDFLTSAVSSKLVEKVHQSIQGRLLRKTLLGSN